MPSIRVAIAQTNPIVGDLGGNRERLVEMAAAAWERGAQVFLTGELAISGYPIEDLALRDDFLQRAREVVDHMASQLHQRGLGDLVVLVGHPDGPFPPPTDLYSPAHPQQAKNCVSVLHNGQVVARYAKHHLPNYSVFDEFRTFLPGEENLILRLGGVDCGVVICEDLWRDDGPVETLSGYPLAALFVPNASPFERDKDDVRLPLVTRRAKEMDLAVYYANLVGGQDDLVFDGDSVVVDHSGTVHARSPLFVEHLQVVTLDLPEAGDHPLPEDTQRVELPLAPPRTGPSDADTGADVVAEVAAEVAAERDDLDVVWNALVTGTRDYVNKNGFPSVMLGLSGGIDSAVCAVIAADAIGPERVHAVSLPSRHSSDHSRDDARELADATGIGYRVEPIADLVAPFDDQLGLSGLAAENVQARVRGVLLMSLSNQEGHLVLTTGNKSELAVGYSTIYGDSVGGYAPIKDVPKTMVWELARWRNARALTEGKTPPIPVSSIEKSPSAELRPDQTDQDSLPDYDTLDRILQLLIVEGRDHPQIVEAGFDSDTVADIVRLVDRAEWKRRQGAIGPRISSVAFGRDRRLPVTARNQSVRPQ
ncbi:NAD+ synthase [Pontimonas sp.]|nr:NAD+ synthase [Pontimonas sp.]MDR9434635.1 NAD+ synthase [Pontimonas sp.]